MLWGFYVNKPRHQSDRILLQSQLFVQGRAASHDLSVRGGVARKRVRLRGPNSIVNSHLSKLAILSVVLGVCFPLGLFLLANRSYPTNPWQEAPPHFLAAIAFIPIGAIVFGHIAAWQIKHRVDASNWRIAKAGLLLGYLGVAALPVVAFFNRPAGLHDESSAVASLRTLNISLKAYADGHPQQGFPAGLADLSSAIARDPFPAWWIDLVLAGGIKSGYRFTYIPRSSTGHGRSDSYGIFADPVRPSNPYTSRHFFTDETGIIRLRKSEKADAQSEILR